MKIILKFIIIYKKTISDGKFILKHKNIESKFEVLG